MQAGADEVLAAVGATSGSSGSLHRRPGRSADQLSDAGSRLQPSDSWSDSRIDREYEGGATSRFPGRHAIDQRGH